MTTAFDQEMAAVVTSLLNDFGTTATLQTTTRGTYSAGGGIRAPGTTVNTTVKVSPPEDMEQARMKGRGGGVQATDVLMTDLMVIMDTADTSGNAVPMPTGVNSKLTVDGTTYAVHTVWSIYSGDDVAAYGLQLRNS